jgi:hypothetical protein
LLFKTYASSLYSCFLKLFYFKTFIGAAMNTKTIANGLTFLLLSTLAWTSNAQDRLNGREAAELCRDEINLAYAGEHRIDFSRKPASSLRGESYTFWINATEEIAGERDSVKYQCEITPTGELVELTREPGRWRI